VTNTFKNYKIRIFVFPVKMQRRVALKISPGPSHIRHALKAPERARCEHSV